MPISNYIAQSMTRSSWIRKMFETGIALKKQYGADKIYDFSLGNPDLPTPEIFNRVLVEESARTGTYVHGYMQNKGYPETCAAVANLLERESGLPFTEDQVVMTCGAAGAINIILKSLLDPGDEVIVIAPFFSEYEFYVDNHRGQLVISEANAELLPDPADIAAKITPRTRVLLLNSPNNPTGRVYGEDIFREIGRLLTEKSAEFGRPIYLLMDEPYKRIIFDGLQYRSPFRYYRHTILASSFSKDLSLAGERIGYLAISPLIEDYPALINAAAFCNRVLGFINAPALMQRVIRRVLDAQVAIELYQKRRDMIYDALVEIGYEIIKPEGTFYLFPKCPIDDDVKFVFALQDRLIITTPGIAFYRPGYFRISYAVPEAVIQAAIPIFKQVFNEMKP
ncbi:MAG TPA: pyridoxal phosphate-dependent aminotransferase [Candidatus Marinimicrobia bacterium]|nr:pyridoxal phosphate-dependent aminotransferase [Candidatus Neomarinimicrobiota bacterium]HQM36046.1 pyridoxal phosphate-dependent aminotransferase [Candidatus Neomarinimicrobiota bacterium]